ncbi:MAG: ribosomal protein S18-alanine N-acetyltransferase [Pseudomonadota bacterium]|jgi:ribosomal-protein-alanine N-acetyltransferase|nr:ribosomal protein S18-alanine N-acetyltransferase [Sphingomonas sp.]MBA3834643.1 ribosomal protein S18-alanine N-acetyltransferase [Sphingomonas sp.]MDQ3483585.1 ribosomal protein S18-alanine N-acetyltransferase [Pseudomonadota bacterium]
MIVTLSDGCAGDLEAVMQVMTDAFGDRYGEAWTRSQCAGILPMSGVRFVLARDGDDQLVGFSLYRTIIDDAELLLLAVGPQAQRRGVGQSLIKHFVEDAKNRGASRIHLEVRDGNPAVRLYEAMGFVQSNRRRNYYRGRDGSKHDALTFMLSET